MEQIKYLDFDILIESSEGEYTVRVLSSPAGEASAKFVLPFSDLELDNIALQLGRTRRGVRRLESPEMEVARNFGRRLFEAVFSQGVRDRLRGSLGSVNREGQGLRLRLRMAGAPELANLPWEYLYDPSLDRFLVLSVQTPLVRFLEVPQPDRPLTVSPPLNVIVMISNPKDYDQLEIEREWDNLKSALGSLEQRGLVSLTRLEEATLDGLLRILRTEEYHTFHFIGHGGFDRQSEDGVLVLEDDHGNSRLVSGRFLGTILHDHRSMRLAILNACEGARTSRSDPFAGVAQSLVLQGIPAVIAMQFEITDEAAITFSQELYGAITDGYPVDGALAESRKAIFAQENDVEWGTPVLYLTSPDGIIFEVTPDENLTAHTKIDNQISNLEIETRIDNLYTEGLNAFWLKEWERASQSFVNILELQPDHQDASTRLEEAEHQLNLQQLKEQAQSAENKQDWQIALSALEELAQLEPDFQDIATRIEKVRRQSQLAALYNEASQLYQAGKWQAVINIFTELDAIDPEFPDSENLRTSAEEEAAAEKRREEIKSLHARAVREMDAGNWQSAQQLLTQVREMEPGYPEIEDLINRVDIELEREELERQKQEQITALYEQALKLARTYHWHQVQEIMDEILTIDPDFSDSEDLAFKAEKEVARQIDKAKTPDEVEHKYIVLWKSPGWVLMIIGMVIVSIVVVVGWRFFSQSSAFSTSISNLPEQILSATSTDTRTTDTPELAAGALVIQTKTPAPTKADANPLVIATSTPTVPTPTVNLIDFNFPSFKSIDGLNLLGDAAQIGDKLRLTSITTNPPDTPPGAAWFTKKVFIQSGFETTFKFQINKLEEDDGADGFAFVIQNSSILALGGPGGFIGYGGIPNSLAIEFDTWENSDSIGDPNDNHISVHTRGTAENSADHTYSLDSTTAISNMSDGNIHTARIEYVPGTLKVFLDDLTIPVLTVSVNLATSLKLENGHATVGFTGATGLSLENHDILSWSFTNTTVEPSIGLLAR